MQVFSQSRFLQPPEPIVTDTEDLSEVGWGALAQGIGCR